MSTYPPRVLELNKAQATEALRMLQARSQVTAAGCWEWTGTCNGMDYGSVYFAGQDWRAHRLAYTAAVGTISHGLVIDHLCRNPKCVRPDHLEAVTPGENTRRGNLLAATAARRAARTHCKHGHLYDSRNTLYHRNHGRIVRVCRECMHSTARAYERRRRAQGPRQDGRRPRQEHCIHGHSLDNARVIVRSGYTTRICRECAHLRSARDYARRQAKAATALAAAPGAGGGNG